MGLIFSGSRNTDNGKIVKIPHATAILATTADGKISDVRRSPARFGSKADREHLERQIAAVDGVLFGRGTLQAYQTTLPLSDRQLLQQRRDANKPPQPVHAVCSHSGDLDSQWRFFQQPIPRWLLTSVEGAKRWQGSLDFDRVIVLEAGDRWRAAFQYLYRLGWHRVAVLGGGELVAALLAEDLIAEFWLTICPLMVGGKDAPGVVGGTGFSLRSPKALRLLSAEAIGEEIFLHYALNPSTEQLIVDS
ncbi:MAG: RibD family protein [Cyanobacteria bacterium SBLK]|nr:RibD family protein [Cyanobacteria bacterium SBLK]